MTVFLDTHVVVWLFQNATSRFSVNARKTIEEHELLISPIVAMELQLLHEIRRLKVNADALIYFLAHRIGLTIKDDSLLGTSMAAIRETWTRDPFDRLIVAQARENNTTLVTKDSTIQKNYSKALW